MAMTLRAIEAIINPDGRVVTELPLPFTHPTRVILTVAIDEEEDINLALTSEDAWAKDWNRTEEDEAWASLQEEMSS